MPDFVSCKNYDIKNSKIKKRKMYLLLGFLRFSVIFFAMPRYLLFTVNLWTIFQKNVLEAFRPQKSKFTDAKAYFRILDCYLFLFVSLHFMTFKMGNPYTS